MQICENKIEHLFLLRVLGITVSSPEGEASRGETSFYTLIIFDIYIAT